MLAVTEIFRSIQGESTWAGWPCTFVRLSGCNLRCRYCDTRYAYAAGRPMRLPDVLRRVRVLGTDLVEVTGGEPLAQEGTQALLLALARLGGTVLLETNGSLPLLEVRPYRVIMDLKCPSSRESARMHLANANVLQPGDEIKFVVSDRADFEWALGMIRDHRLDRPGLALLFSPVAGVLAPADLAAWVLESGVSGRLQMQLHRILWPDRERGV